MALIDYVTAETASEKAKAYFEGGDADAGTSSRYAGIRDEKGRSLYTELRLHNPEVLEAQHEFGRRILDGGAVDEALYEIVMVAVAQANECAYCAGSHRENLDLLLGMDEAVIEAIAEGDFSSLSRREQVVADFAARCTEDPHRIRREDIEQLYDVGFDDADLIQLLVVIGKCNTANLVVNALDAHPADLDREFRY